MIEDWKIWAAIAGLAIASYAIRFSFLGLLGGDGVPLWLSRALAFVPAAVLPALIAPMVLTGEGGALAVDGPKLAASLAALGAGLATRNVLAGVLGGVAGYALALALG